MIKKRHILRLLLKSRKGLIQVKKYNKKAKEFWKNKREELIGEIIQVLDSSTDAGLMKLSNDFMSITGFRELRCRTNEIHEFRKILKNFGSKNVIKDFVDYAARTGFLTVVIAPALAVAEGLGDVDEETINEWLYGIGICLPVSADICDSVLDGEVLKHPLIPYKNWVACHKLCTAIIYQIGFNHASRIRDGEMKERVMDRLKAGIQKVSEKQRMDFEVKTTPFVPLSVLEEIYDGKICEIEATVFGTIPSNKTDIVKTFEEGARSVAGELQVADDMEDLLGDPNIGKPPQVPNPSFFLRYCIDSWNNGERDLSKIMKEAARKTLYRGEEYHKRVSEAYNRLPKKFPTKPFFEVTIWCYNKVLKDRFKQFLKGKTYPVIRPELLNILNSIRTS